MESGDGKPRQAEEGTEEAQAAEEADALRTVSPRRMPLASGLLRAVLAVAATLAMGASAAAELAVLSAGAVEPGLRAAISAWQQETGNVANVTFNAAPQITQRLEAAEKFDVVIAPQAIVERFVRTGVLGPETVMLGKVGVGVAVRNDAPVPDVSTPDALRRALLEADSVVFNRASTGVYVEAMLKKMGVYEAIEPRVTRVTDGAAVMEHVLRGKGREIGLGAITEILLVRERGLRYVGPLPPELQNMTAYVAAVPRAGASPAVADAFVRYLGASSSRAKFAAAGIQ
jgi:molybdate transport system substrate-binding protein